jgi:cell division protein FtsW (lipid II flippase)
MDIYHRISEIHRDNAAIHGEKNTRFFSAKLTGPQRISVFRIEAILLLLAAAFLFANATALSLVRTGGINGRFFTAPLIWLLLMGATHLLLNWRLPRRDPLLLPLYALLTGWGLLLIDRLAANFLMRQVVWLVISTAVLLLIASLAHRHLDWLRRYRYTWLIGGLLLLAATFLFGVNPSGFGAALWLPIPLSGQVFFQPSELLKLLLIAFLASYFHERESLLRLSRQRGSRFVLPYLVPLLLMWGFCMLLLIWQEDLGAATLFFVLFLCLLYLATGRRGYVLLGLGLLLLASFFAYHLFAVVALRVDIWLNPWPEANNRAYQIVQSLYALAAGGLGGTGIGQGYPNYIPVVHSDFAFAAIAEEWGLIGSLSVVVCFILLVYRGFRLAALAPRPFYTYLAAGITIMFSIQALLIMGGVTRLLPLTGVTLPFVSYGGSSLLVSAIMMGVLLLLSEQVAGGK